MTRAPRGILRTAIAIVLLWAAAVAATAATAAAHPSPGARGAASSAKSVSWTQGDATLTATESPDELAIFLAPGSSLDGSAAADLVRRSGALAGPLTGSGPFVIFVRMARGDMEAAAATAAAALSGDGVVTAVSPVFYRGLPSADTRLALTGRVLLRTLPGEAASVARLASAQGARLAALGAGPAASVAHAPSALASLALARRLGTLPGVTEALPEWYHARATRGLPDDPLFAQQWHLLNTGQSAGKPGVDVDVTPVWDTDRGSADHVIAIIDDGLDVAHPDLAPNVVLGLSWDYVGNDANPSPGSGENHGTACGGVAAARGFNGVGVSGVAPQAGLAGLRLLAADSDANEAAALTRSQDAIDVRSASWGPADDRHLEAPGPLTQAALADGVANGRGGRGTVFVWAGGNGAQAYDNSNFDGYANSRYVIAVGAVGNDGVQAWYSEPGANLLVAAPSSGGSLAITTTDRAGSAGYSSGDYTNSFGGTSATAPEVAGVAELMLTANPYLSWRDVQAILATTAVKNDPTDAGWSVNGAGYHVDHKYGFGLVNAEGAVAAAKTWTPLGPEVSAEGSAAPGVTIPDGDLGGVTSTIHVARDVTVESVDVVLTAPHPFWSDLRVELTSPDGTVSVLAEPSLDQADDNGYDHWRFSTKRSFGESSLGDWTLRVADTDAGEIGTFDSWSIAVYGHAPGVFSDTTPPVTTATGYRGWHRRATTVTLAASDPDSPVGATQFRVDGSPWQTGTSVVVAAPRSHANDGIHLLEFHSFDTGDGPTEVVRSVEVRVDTRGPVTRAPRPAAAGRGHGAVLRYRVNDALSPYARVIVRVTDSRGRVVKTLRLGRRRTGRSLRASFVCTLAPGSYRFAISARDLAGNAQTRRGSNLLTVTP